MATKFELPKNKQLPIEYEALAEAVVEALSSNIVITQKSVLTTDEAARYMGIAKSSLYKLMMRKLVPYSQPTGKVAYFNRAELETWLMSHRVATADELSDRAQAYCAHSRSQKKGGAK